MCKSYIKLDVHENVISDATFHKHVPDDPSHLNRRPLSNVSKRKVLLDISKKPSKIICAELSADNHIKSTVQD